jgi:hypothetical protein
MNFDTTINRQHLTSLALWAIVKGFPARKSLSCYGFSCLKEERFLKCFETVLVSEGFWGFLDKTGLTGLPNRSDRFPVPVERLSPTEAV